MALYTESNHIFHVIFMRPIIVCYSFIFLSFTGFTQSTTNNIFEVEGYSSALKKDSDLNELRREALWNAKLEALFLSGGLIHLENSKRSRNTNSKKNTTDNSISSSYHTVEKDFETIIRQRIDAFIESVDQAKISLVFINGQQYFHCKARFRVLEILPLASQATVGRKNKYAQDIDRKEKDSSNAFNEWLARRIQRLDSLALHIQDLNDGSIIARGDAIFSKRTKEYATTGEALFTPPLQGIKDVKSFDLAKIPSIKEYENGYLFEAKEGTPVFAINAASVIATGWVKVLGNRVVLEHENGMRSIYGYLKNVRVREGAKISRGTIIGYVGQTGMYASYCLYFELSKNNVGLNPFLYW